MLQTPNLDNSIGLSRTPLLKMTTEMSHVRGVTSAKKKSNSDSSEYCLSLIRVFVIRLSDSSNSINCRCNREDYDQIMRIAKSCMSLVCLAFAVRICFLWRG